MNPVYERPWVIAAAATVALGLNLVFLGGGYARVLRGRTGRRVPEGGLRYSVTSVRLYMTDAGTDGWRLYRLELWWDIAYSVLFAAVGTVLLRGLWGLHFGSDWGWVLWIPAAAGAVDACEDLFLLRAIRCFDCPDGELIRHPGSIGVGRVFTWGKFALYLAEVGALLLASILLIGAGGAHG